MEHFPVLKKEVLEWMEVRNGGVYVDATCGFGGHSLDILKEGNDKNIFLVGIDKDKKAIDLVSEKLKGYENFKIIQGGFENLKGILQKLHIEKIDGILFDLGFSTYQIKDRSRGFSFYLEGPIDMRYDRNNILTAGEIINTWSKKELIWIFKNFGEIKKPEKIVNKICDRRKNKKFETTTELSGFIFRYYHGGRKRLHPATLFFQALRIAANDELEVLKEGLIQAKEVLKQGGKILVISFHSLEDRIVKRFFRDNEEFKVLTKKPVVAERAEVIVNPESRSAKLRVAERI